jgi:hypothetical protein
MDAGIHVGTSFNIRAAQPVDVRTVVDSISARDAIPSGLRYNGLMCFVQSESVQYQLQNGIENTDWQRMGSGGAGTIEDMHGLIEFPQTRTYPIISHSSYNMRIDRFRYSATYTSEVTATISPTVNQVLSAGDPLVMNVITTVENLYTSNPLNFTITFERV